jgi:hypothetical protein
VVQTKLNQIPPYKGTYAASVSSTLPVSTNNSVRVGVAGGAVVGEVLREARRQRFDIEEARNNSEWAGDRVSLKAQRVNRL